MVIAKERDESSHVQTITPENILTQTEANRFEPSAPMSCNQGEKKKTLPSPPAKFYCKLCRSVKITME